MSWMSKSTLALTAAFFPIVTISADSSARPTPLADSIIEAIESKNDARLRQLTTEKMWLVETSGTPILELNAELADRELTGCQISFKRDPNEQIWRERHLEIVWDCPGKKSRMGECYLTKYHGTIQKVAKVSEDPVFLIQDISFYSTKNGCAVPRPPFSGEKIDG